MRHSQSLQLVMHTDSDGAHVGIAKLRIERIGAGEQRPRPLTPGQLVRGLQGAAMFVQGSATLFENWAESFLPMVRRARPRRRHHPRKLLRASRSTSSQLSTLFQ